MFSLCSIQYFMHHGCWKPCCLQNMWFLGLPRHWYSADRWRKRKDRDLHGFMGQAWKWQMWFCSHCCLEFSHMSFLGTRDAGKCSPWLVSFVLTQLYNMEGCRVLLVENRLFLTQLVKKKTKTKNDARICAGILVNRFAGIWLSLSSV